MKNPLAGINFKKILIDHGEKIALGSAGLVVVLALAVGTQWSRYEGDPAKLEEKANSAGETIDLAQWPEEERRAFVASTEGAAAPQTRVNNMIADLDLEDPRFAFDKRSPMIWKPIPPRQLRAEPEWSRLLHPVADAGRIVIDIPLASDTPEVADAGAISGDSLTSVSREDADALAITGRNPFQRRGASGSTATQPGAGLSDGLAPGAGLGGLEGFAPPAMETQIQGAGGEEMTESYGTGAPSGYPTHYIAVRMIFPAREQLKAVLKACGPISPEEALSIYDFEIERQHTIAGPEGWSKWEKFDLESTLRLLDLVAAFEDPIMDPSVVDPTITMPLPVPKYGFWGDDAEHASHPMLKDKKLSADARAMMATVQGTVVGMAQDYMSQQTSAFPGIGAPETSEMSSSGAPQKKGWGSKLKDFRQVAGGALKEREKAIEVAKKVREQLEAEFGPNVGMFNLQQLTMMGENFLFRFVDFDLEPGRAYRYRARLVLENPNAEQSLDRVTHPSVVEGEFRETEWSEPTEPVVIEHDIEYYVEEVNRGSGQRSDTAAMRLHVWSEALGTWVAQKVTVEPGEPVGGTKAVSTDVVDLVKDTYEETKVRFETEDLLADVLTTPNLPRDDEFHAQYLSIPRSGLDIRSPAVVLTEMGEMIPLDPIEQDPERLRANRRVEDQLAGFAWLKQTAAAAGTEGDPLGDGNIDAGDGNISADGNVGMYETRPSRRRSRPKRANALRIGGDVDRQLPAAGTGGGNIDAGGGR